MKQLIIGQKKAYASGVTYTDLTKVPEGAIGLFKPSDGSLISSAEDLTENFAVVCGRGENKMPIHFPEVDVKSLTVEKAEYAEGKTFTAAITVPTTEKGKEYTILLSKAGVVFNERNNWTFTAMAKDTTAANVAAALVKAINGNTTTTNLTAENSGGKITIKSLVEGENWYVKGADELLGVEPTDVTQAVPAILDKAFVQDLASRCAAGKGFNYLGEDGAEIYPGYPEVVADDQYVLYTLRFAVPRVASKQRDEVVFQLLHIAVPVGSGVISTLDAIFGDKGISTLSAKNGVKIEIPGKE